ncbi:MAG: hypothetical protein MI717_14735 [Spirochaetales bacterium]|nr:hypothetical protein [Spirochaetales bacterium]
MKPRGYRNGFFIVWGIFFVFLGWIGAAQVQGTSPLGLIRNFLERLWA